MSRSSFLRLAEQEALEGFVFLDEQAVRENTVVMERRDAGIAVYLTNERAGIEQKTLRLFDTEAEALAHMLHKLRQGARLERSLGAWRTSRTAEGPASER